MSTVSKGGTDGHTDRYIGSVIFLSKVVVRLRFDINALISTHVNLVLNEFIQTAEIKTIKKNIYYPGLSRQLG